MKKPDPHAEFASDADQREHIINCLCWHVAEQSFDDMAEWHEAAGYGPGGTLEELADCIKEMVQNGLVRIEADKRGNHFRLVPGIAGTA
jgi:hypothetical protein